mmetsp:Transcript_20400/g.39850  ORF Transcript_20400/g.39850 Transcript_20400/m.39850 type:complete len:224 (+) Transcript_20400:452-1123(+)
MATRSGTKILVSLDITVTLRSNVSQHAKLPVKEFRRQRRHQQQRQHNHPAKRPRRHQQQRQQDQQLQLVLALGSIPMVVASPNHSVLMALSVGRVSTVVTDSEFNAPRICRSCVPQKTVAEGRTIVAKKIVNPRVAHDRATRLSRPFRHLAACTSSQCFTTKRLECRKACMAAWDTPCTVVRLWVTLAFGFLCPVQKYPASTTFRFQTQLSICTLTTAVHQVT